MQFVFVSDTGVHGLHVGIELHVLRSEVPRSFRQRGRMRYDDMFFRPVFERRRRELLSVFQRLQTMHELNELPSLRRRV